MKTKATFQKLTLFLFVTTLLSLSSKIMAQCNADFTYMIDNSDNGHVTFTNTSSSTGGVNYNWYFGDGGYSNATSPIHTYNTGTYTVEMHMYDSTGFCSDTTFYTISVINNMPVNCSASFQTIDSAGYTYFINQSTGTNLISTWYFGDGSVATGDDVIHQYQSSGPYNAWLYITDSSGWCSSNFSAYVTGGNSNPGMCQGTVNSYFTVSTDTSGYVNFYNNVTGSSPAYVWNFGDGTIGSDIGNTTHYYSSPGTYNVCLFVYETNGTYDSCEYCSSVTITAGSPQSCFAYFTISQSVVNENECSMNNYSSGNSLNYSWDFGDGETSGSANPFHIYPTVGTFNTCLTVTSSIDSTCSNTYCHAITFGNPAPNCDASFMLIQDSTDLLNYYIYNNSINLSNTATFSWDFGDGTSSTLQYPTHTYSVSGAYEICLTISDSDSLNNCTNTYCDTLGAGRASGPMNLTVVNQSPTGISGLIISSSLSNYPNPFNGSTTISYSISSDATIQLNIVDLLGNRIAVIENNRKQQGNYTVLWNSGNVAEGMYLLQMKVDNQTSTRKIIIK
jgi:PKD repeat protein